MFSIKKPEAILAPLLSASLAIISLWMPIGFTTLKAQETPTAWFEAVLPTKNDYDVRSCSFVQSANYQVTLWQCLLRYPPKPTNAEGNPNEILWMIPITSTGHWQTPEIFDPLDNGTITSKRLIGEILAVNQHGEWLVRPPAQPPAATVNYNDLRLVHPLINNSQKYSVQELSQRFAHVKWAKNTNNDQWLVWDDWSSVGEPQSLKSDIQIMAITRQGKKIWLKSTISNNDDFQNPYGLVSKDSETIVWTQSQAKNNILTTRLFCISNITKDRSDSNYINFPAGNFRLALPLVKENKILLLGTSEENGHQWIVGWVVYVDKGCKATPWGRFQLPNHFNQQPAYSWLEHAIVTEKDEIVIFYGQQWDVRFIDFVRRPDQQDLRADLWALKIVPDDSRDIIWDRKIISREDPISEAFSIDLWDEAAWQKIGLKNWGLSLAYLPAINQILLHPQKPINIPNNTVFPKNPRIYKVEIQ
ncbi:MAG: hypothetical protein JNK86_06635 [Alphaproteobacteria bacterium]|nr:hypothetical protein [Alphaproteobacteria bacterium]